MPLGWCLFIFFELSHLFGFWRFNHYVQYRCGSMPIRWWFSKRIRVFWLSF